MRYNSYLTLRVSLLAYAKIGPGTNTESPGIELGIVATAMGFASSMFVQRVESAEVHLSVPKPVTYLRCLP